MSCRFTFKVAIALCVPSLAFAMNVTALPTGMCALNKNNPVEAEVINYLKSANAGSNEVLASFASCSELAAITAKKGSAITHYGAILSQTLGQQLPIDRKAYVETAATLYAANGASLTETALTGAREAATTGTQGSDIKNPKSMTADSKGILFKNDDMVIIGIKQTNNFGSESHAVASTAAMTLIGGKPVSVNLYAPASDAGAFQKSAATLQPFVATLIAANP
jgi:hypothetical protein